MAKMFLFSSLLLLLFSQCRNDGLSHTIYLENSSGASVCYYMPWEYWTFYPDTILPENNPNPWEFDENYTINFGEGSAHENALFDLFPTDTMSVFFFDPDTLAKYDWETIRKEYKILARYDLSHQDLRALDWRIYYPPSEAMKNMKIYLPMEVPDVIK